MVAMEAGLEVDVVYGFWEELLLWRMHMSLEMRSMSGR